MAGVFQNIYPSPPGEYVPAAFGAGGGHTRWVERGVRVGVNILEDVRHSSVLYVCKYFVFLTDNAVCSEGGLTLPPATSFPYRL